MTRSERVVVEWVRAGASGPVGLTARAIRADEATLLARAAALRELRRVASTRSSTTLIQAAADNVARHASEGGR